VWENSYEGNSTSVKEAAVPIAEIERRSGFEFFRNLNPEIAAEVKSQNNYDDWKKAFGLSK
jgi:DNA/RNA endonuclease G (NUC1)